MSLETLLLDWREPESLRGRRFDVVLAADVLYEEGNGRRLLDLLPHVVAENGAVLVADPGRRHAPELLDAAATAAGGHCPPSRRSCCPAAASTACDQDL